MKNLRVQAEYIIASPQRVLNPGQVEICGGLIIDVGPASSRPDITLDGVALLPGFINCHTHLEFSDLQQPFPAGNHFPEWISSVVGWRMRNQQNLELSELENARRSAIAAGLFESYHAGTAVVADIVTPPWSPTWLDDLPQATRQALNPMRGSGSHLDELTREHLGPVAMPRVIALPEILGHQPERFQSMLDWATATQKLSAMQQSPTLIDIGVSPHAPYSLRWDADSARCLRQATRVGLAAMHVAESPAEVQWLRDGSGPFAEFLQRLQITTTQTRLQFSDAFELLSRAQRGLLVHGYYLEEEDIRLATNAGELAVVYCPRTCQHFHHRPLDLTMLARHLPVVLGTDSRASNPDLSMWRELLALRQIHPDLDPTVAFGMATSQAAAALQLAASHGELAPGKLACINALELSTACSSNQLIEQITNPGRAQGEPLPLVEFFHR